MPRSMGLAVALSHDAVPHDRMARIVPLRSWLAGDVALALACCVLPRVPPLDDVEGGGGRPVGVAIEFEDEAGNGFALCAMGTTLFVPTRHLAICAPGIVTLSAIVVPPLVLAGAALAGAMRLICTNTFMALALGEIMLLAPLGPVIWNSRRELQAMARELFWEVMLDQFLRHMRSRRA